MTTEKSNAEKLSDRRVDPEILLAAQKYVREMADGVHANLAAFYAFQAGVAWERARLRAQMDVFVAEHDAVME